MRLEGIRDPDARALVRWCLQANPLNRPTMGQVLTHPFLARISPAERTVRAARQGALAARNHHAAAQAADVGMGVTIGPL